MYLFICKPLFDGRCETFLSYILRNSDYNVPNIYYYTHATTTTNN